ncbi:hypothetical protein ACFCWT_13265 [Streptomyces olivaceus]|uniref:hypothetical protein n=1 Tax=Streptomyces olivaceus TaxID=47716 RepID=UPI0035E02B11
MSVSARERIHAMLPILDNPVDADTREAQLDRHLDAHRAEVLAEDGQAYDGELAMLRSLVRTLRVVVRPDDAGVAEVRKLLHEHADDDRAARQGGGRG